MKGQKYNGILFNRNDYSNNNNRIYGVQIMTQLTDEHFELHTKNKAEQFERQKIKFLEDRITTLEKSIERLNKIVSIWKLGQEENNHE